MGHLALRLLSLVEAIPDAELRYQGKLGEQLRGELTAAQRALSDLRQAAEGALKLGLAEPRAGRAAGRHRDRSQHGRRVRARRGQHVDLPVRRIAEVIRPADVDRPDGTGV